MDLKWLTDEAEGWRRIQELRAAFSPKLFAGVRSGTRDQVVVRGIDAVGNILRGLTAQGLDLYDAEPGHAVGHWVRDYCHAIALCSELEADPQQLFVGFLGGTLHDIGCSVVPRYQDSKRVVRHGEAGALLLLDLFAKDSCGLNEAEQLLVAYAVAAHTHYLKPQTVVCAAGETRVIEPYKDLEDDGKPIYGVWIARWTDRLDTNGPAFVGRHFLTLVDVHEDFAGAAGFQTIEFGPHMRPLLRDKPDGPQTMVEHLRMFARSQTNESAYGKHDFGAMVTLRDDHRAQLEDIIAATQSPPEGILARQGQILRAWTLFLATNVEPSLKGARAAARLSQMFEGLDEQSRAGWLNGFLVCMEAYGEWQEMLIGDGDAWERRFLGWSILPGLDADIITLTAASHAWDGLLQND